MSVADALDLTEPGEQVRVRAYLVTEAGVPFLCDSVEDSDPEQCSEPNLEVVGAPLGTLGLTEQRDGLSGSADMVVTIDGQTATFVSLGTDS